MMNFTIICASHDRNVLDENLLRSPCIRQRRCECTIVENTSNVSVAYNKAASDASTELVCFVHHDVYLPEGWDTTLLEQVEQVKREDSQWALLGCAGVYVKEKTKYWAGHLDDRGAAFDHREGLPRVVDTLDEVVLVCRRNDAAFDEWMPNHHLYATELCLRRRREGRRVYAVDAYCHHLSRQSRARLPWGFALSAGYLYGKYPEMLPIVTTCATIQRINGVCVLSD